MHGQIKEKTITRKFHKNCIQTITHYKYYDHVDVENGRLLPNNKKLTDNTIFS